MLGNDFPGLRTLAGDAFEPLALDYIEATRSPYYNVRWYGAGLADHLRSRAPWTEQPAFAEMAALEWAMGLAFDAADAAVAGVTDVAAIAPEDWPRLRLRLHPSLQRLRLQWNLNAIRNAVDADGGPIPALQKLDQAQPWVVWRKDLGVRYRRLEADEAAALNAAALGATFPELCLLLCEWHPPETVAQRAATLLRTWVEDDWISALEFSDG